MPPFHWWRTVFFLIPLISAYTIVLGTLSIGSSLVGRRGVFAHRCARAWAWLVLATTGVQVSVSGLERLARGRPYVFVSNHESIYDIPVVFASLPFQLRIIAKDALARFPFLGWHLRRTGHVLVHRQSPGVSTFRRVSDLLRHGLSLIVFPEGTRNLDGRVGRFKGGIFLLAIQAGLPIVPVTVVGTRFVMPKGRLMVCPGRVGLVVHDLISTTGLTRDDAKTIAARVHAVVQGAVGALPPAHQPDPGAEAVSGSRR
jgi:1-acyl-sn-glycerol-3-phosphate acyltransferase